MQDDLGDRMKLYEQQEAGKLLIPTLPILVRLDGKGFHNWTKGLNRPFDQGLSDLMIYTTQYLVEETNACLGYCQSDEISLVLHSDDPLSQVFFNGKIQKLNSVICSMATAYFNSMVPSLVPSKIGKLAIFDSKVWNVPNKTEAANAILWREQDATKNSISMAAHSVYSHKALMNKNGKEKQDMLFQKGINWNNYPDFFKRGTFIQRKKVLTKFSCEEISKLPTKHAARKDPNMTIERSKVMTVPMPKFSSVINREDVIFNGQEPIVK